MIRKACAGSTAGSRDLPRNTKSFPDELSGGEQQRVCPRESTRKPPGPSFSQTSRPGNLDPKTSEEIMKLLEQINEKGTTGTGGNT